MKNHFTILTVALVALLAGCDAVDAPISDLEESHLIDNLVNDPHWNVQYLSFDGPDQHGDLLASYRFNQASGPLYEKAVEVVPTHCDHTPDVHQVDGSSTVYQFTCDEETAVLSLWLRFSPYETDDRWAASNTHATSLETLGDIVVEENPWAPGNGWPGTSFSSHVYLDFQGEDQHLYLYESTMVAERLITEALLPLAEEILNDFSTQSPDVVTAKTDDSTLTIEEGFKSSVYHVTSDHVSAKEGYYFLKAYSIASGEEIPVGVGSNELTQKGFSQLVVLGERGYAGTKTYTPSDLRFELWFYDEGLETEELLIEGSPS
jgi:hypothetical protein